ncbi:hypothetical protein [Echinicola shivajiensis]|uniref:hypothetical protein n=1 Tax=Echinicola shivajiensis TaxID=1035916 RepID=UPI001BFC0F78|nr:hypothetical protein [Echinicola shivajiensis]
MEIQIHSYIIIFLFFLERLFKHWSSKQDDKRSWYMQVIITPKITFLDDVFIKLDKLFNEELDSALAGNQIVDKQGSKDKIIFKLQEIRKELNVSFLEIISSLDSNLYDALNHTVQELYDQFTNMVYSENHQESSIILSNFKSEFYLILYKPLNDRGIRKSISIYFQKNFVMIVGYITLIAFILLFFVFLITAIILTFF